MIHQSPPVKQTHPEHLPASMADVRGRRPDASVHHLHVLQQRRARGQRRVALRALVLAHALVLHADVRLQRALLQEAFTANRTL